MPRHLLWAAAACTLAMPAAAEDAAQCAALTDTVIDAGFVTSARVIEPDGLPAYCEVRATALPEISIEVRLPMTSWNGHLYQAGCGGFCGVLGRADAAEGWINAMRPGLAKGYATATSDGGHHGTSVLDASWADSNPQAERDWGWRSVGETNRVAEAMIAAFYGEARDRAVFQGCSTGGRMALAAALRYPDVFDGIIAGAPAMDYTGLVGAKFSAIVQANTDAEGTRILGPGKDMLVGDAVMAQCDRLDGKADGLIADPRACTPDLSGLQCTGAVGPDCLSAAELGVVEAWYAGPEAPDGAALYPGGIPAGSEPFWWLWLTGNADGAGNLVPAFAQNFGAYMAFPDDPGAGWSPLEFDMATDLARMAPLAAVYNADDPDLTTFREAGGKMIVWHGWADAIVTPFKTVEWHAQAAEVAGGADALAEDVALFMVPGLDHCGILEGPAGLTQSDLDPLTPLETWMDGGDAPTTIMVDQSPMPGE